MGSKGSSPQTTQSQQQYTPNPYIAGGGQQAISGAEYAASQPFQLPVAPLAPFSPFQNQAFSGVQQAVGMAQPYFGMGAGYLQGSAAPITGQDVSGYYNPMASNVMAGMQDIFGQQMQETTGQLQQQAGGVGADRVAVGQANLAKQQGLAAGQTLAGLYYPALQAAQQQKQMMAGAGYGLGQMGPAAQGAQLQSLQAMLGAGGMQQQLAQQYLNNLYQNRLAQIGYQFQTPQYLAGITGGLAPAMGGTTSGLQQQWAAQPSPLAQALGIGTSLLGLGMAPFTGGASLGLTGLGGSMMGGGMGGKGSSPTVLGGSFRSGGRVPTHMKGGGAPTTLPKAPDPVYSPKAMTETADPLPPGGISTEEAEAQADPYFQWYGGVPAVNRAQIAAMTTPQAQRMAPPSPMSMAPQTAAISSPMGASPTEAPDMFRSWMQRMQQKEPDLVAPDPFGLEAAASLGKANGGATPDQVLDTKSPIPKTDSASVVPTISLPMGAGHSGLSPGQGIEMKAPSAPSSGGIGGDVSKALDAVSKMSRRGSSPMNGSDSIDIPEDEAMGGAVGPMSYGQGFQEGGDIDPDFQYDTAGARPRDPHFTMGDLVDRASDFYFPPQSQESPANVYKVAQSLGIPQPFAERKRTSATTAPMTSDVGDIPYETPSAGPEDVTSPMPQERPMAAPGLPGSTIERAANVTKAQESGDYGHVETTRNRRGQLQRALGAYGIMEDNVGPWTKELYGEAVSPEEFLRNPNIQDAVYRNKMGQYIQKYGIEGAGRAWLGGEGNIGNPMASDPYGTRVGDYGRKFASAVEGGEGAESARFAQYSPMGQQTEASMAMPMGQAPTPYPDATQRDWGQRLTRSPWMSLVQAGAAMATTVGPIGSVIGQGIKAGAGELEGQRKELRDEESINQKAQSLYQQAQIHLDKYTKMTPYEQARIQQENWAPLYTTNKAGQPIVLDRKSGRTINAITGEPVRPDEELVSTRGKSGAEFLYNVKREAWLAEHPGDNAGALEYASGRRQIPEAQAQKWAADTAAKEVANNPALDLDERQKFWFRRFMPGAADAAGDTVSKTVRRTGKINSGPNAGKTIVEYTDGTTEVQ